MILTEAKKRAQEEFDTVLGQTRTSLDRMRQYEAQTPSIKQSTYRMHQGGVAGTAANYVLALANHM